MDKTFEIKRGDLSPVIRARLEPDDLNLTGATIEFRMKRRRGPTVIVAPGAVASGLGFPAVEYEWQAGDTDSAGIYEAEFRVTYSDDAPETFPNDGPLLVLIFNSIPDLEP